MKVILLLLAVFLVHVFSFQEETSNVAAKEEFKEVAVLNRAVRNAKKNNEEKKKKNKKCRKGRKCKKRKGSGKRKRQNNGKKTRPNNNPNNPNDNKPKRKKFDRRIKKKNKKGKTEKNKGKKKNRPANINPGGSFKRKEVSACGRQANKCFEDLVKIHKKFNAAQTNIKMASRIENWHRVMRNKKNTSSDTFKDSADAMKDSTGGGKKCGGKDIDKQSKEVHDKLQNCAKTAAANCDNSNMTNPVNTSLVKMCTEKLTAFTKAYKDCLQITDSAKQCTCFQGLTSPPEECLKFKATNDELKTRKQKCTKGTNSGSFGDCRKQERLAAKFGNKCKVGCGKGTTKAPPGGGRLQFLNQLRQNVWKK